MRPPPGEASIDRRPFTHQPEPATKDDDPWRSTILLLAGDEAGQWNAWYREAILLAEQRYEIYLKERVHEEGGQP